MQSPFGRPLFDRLGLNPAAGPAGYATMQPDQSIEAQIADTQRRASVPMPSWLIPQRVLRDSSPRPLPFVPQMQTPSRALPLPQGSPTSSVEPNYDGFLRQTGGDQGLTRTGSVGPLFPLPPPLTNASRPPFLTNSVVLPESGFSTVGPGSAPANVQPINSGGLSNMAFPTLASSRLNTFTGGLFGGNNPMNNNPMNGGGMNSNQPLSQQIPQVVQQAVTPLLQNTATQLNQGIGSMVNQSLVGGGGQTGLGGMPLPSNMSNLLRGGGFNPFR